MSTVMEENQTREKAVAESMSSQARKYREGLELQREQNHEEMVSEVEEKLEPIEYLLKENSFFYTV